MAIAWKLETATIPEQGLEGVRSADGQERTAIADAMGVLACERFEVRYEARSLPRGRYLLSGRLEADVVQRCVVSLDPVANRIEEEFSVEFWPPEQLASPSLTESTVLEADDPEPIEGRSLPIGRLFYQICTAALDPYPRQQGAVLEAADTQQQAGAADPENSPFAALARWRPKEP